MAATNRNLSEEVTQGRFRADLFYRLNVVSIHIPPLRERPEDIPVLIDHYLAYYRERFNRPSLDISDEAHLQLQAYSWPGNVRELRNCLERAAALSTGNTILIDQMIPQMTAGQTWQKNSAIDELVGGPPPTLEEIERQHILHILEQA